MKALSITLTTIVLSVGLLLVGCEKPTWTGANAASTNLDVQTRNQDEFIDVQIPDELIADPDSPTEYFEETVEFDDPETGEPQIGIIKLEVTIEPESQKFALFQVSANMVSGNNDDPGIFQLKDFWDRYAECKKKLDCGTGSANAQEICIVICAILVTDDCRQDPDCVVPLH